MPSIVPNADKGRAGSLQARSGNADQHAGAIFDAVTAMALELPSTEVTLTNITERLSEVGYRSSQGQPLTPTMVARALARCGGTIDGIRWVVWRLELEAAEQRTIDEWAAEGGPPDFETLIDPTHKPQTHQRDNLRWKRMQRVRDVEPKWPLFVYERRLKELLDKIAAFEEYPFLDHRGQFDGLVAEYKELCQKMLAMK